MRRTSTHDPCVAPPGAVVGQVPVTADQIPLAWQVELTRPPLVHTPTHEELGRAPLQLVLKMAPVANGTPGQLATLLVTANESHVCQASSHGIVEEVDYKTNIEMFRSSVCGVVSAFTYLRSAAISLCRTRSH